MFTNKSQHSWNDMVTSKKEIVSALGVIFVFVFVIFLLFFQTFLIRPRARNPYDDNPPSVNLNRYNVYPPD